MAKTSKSSISARQFLQTYLTMERPNTSHLFYSKGVLDFLVGMVIGIVIGIIIANFI